MRSPSAERHRSTRSASRKKPPGPWPRRTPKAPAPSRSASSSSTFPPRSTSAAPSGSSGRRKLRDPRPRPDLTQNSPRTRPETDIGSRIPSSDHLAQSSPRPSRRTSGSACVASRLSFPSAPRCRRPARTRCPGPGVGRSPVVSTITLSARRVSPPSMNMRASVCASAGTGRTRARRGSTLRGILGSPPSVFLPRTPSVPNPSPVRPVRGAHLMRTVLRQIQMVQGARNRTSP